MNIAERPFRSPAIENPRILPKESLRLPMENTYRLFSTGKEVIDRVIHNIEHAKYSVDLQFYTFEADETGQRVINAMKRAKLLNPNLSIRLLVDNSINILHNGSAVAKSTVAREKREETYRALQELKDQGVADVAITNFFDIWVLYSNILHRDHKKLALFDARLRPEEDLTHLPTAIVTSANIANHHIKWKDVGVEMTGLMVPLIQEDFDYTAKHAKEWERIYSVLNPVEYFKKYGRDIFKHPLHAIHDAYGAIIRNPERMGWKRQYGLKDSTDGRGGTIATDSFYVKEATRLGEGLIRSAQKGDIIDIVTPYPGMLHTTGHLIDAARRGATVSLVVPGKNNYGLYDPDRVVFHTYTNPLAKIWEQRLRKSGVGIYKFKGDKGNHNGMIHAKIIRLQKADGTTYVFWGSANMTRGWLSGSNREIAVMTSDKSVVEQFHTLLDEDIKKDSDFLPPQPNGRR